MERSRDLTFVLTAMAAAGLFLVWTLAAVLLLMFAGLLFDVLLDACALGLGVALRIPCGWRIGLACLILAGAVTTVAVWGGFSLVQQASSLLDFLDEQIRVVRGHLEALGLGPGRPSGGQAETLREFLLPDPQSLTGHARTALGAALGLLGSAVVIVVFIGLFVAASPDAYRCSALSFVPPLHRRRLGEVLDGMAETLRWWLVGQLVTMALVAVTMWVVLLLIGVSDASGCRRER
jgi:predicted PurR-regulated permease PerM